MSNLVKEISDVLEAYIEIESIPEFLLNCTKNYNNNVHEENRKFETENKNLNQNYEKSCQMLSANLKKNKNDAEQRKKELFEQLSNLNADADDMVANFNENIALIPAKKGTYKIGKILNEVVARIKTKEEQSYNTFFEKLQILRNQISDMYKKETEEADKSYEAQLKSLNNETDAKRKHLIQSHKDKLQELYDNAVNEIINNNPKHHKEIYTMLESLCPSEINFDPPAEIPETMQIGNVSVNLSAWTKQMPFAEQLIEVIKDNYSFALKENEDNKVTLQFPVGRNFSDNGLNQAILFNKNTRADAIDYINALEMRLFMSLPCGKLRVTMLDPVDLGANFNMFSCLGDIDERIISTKIWSEESRIEEQLNLLINQIEHVNQDCLRKEFTNIVEYNAKVGKNAEPYQVLFVADFPKNLNDKSISCLEKIISSGPKCGVYTIIISEVNSFKQFAHLSIGDMWQLNFADDFSYSYGNTNYSFVPITLPKKENTDAILTAISNGIKNSGKIIITYDEISENLTQHKEKWFRFSCRNGIDIPIGLEGARRSVNVHLGGENITQHHALISGTTGSGKSTLLHTIIMSILLHYSPEDVQIMLLDFKRGVEFKSYAKYKLPNFRIISIDTEPEFGLSVFRALNSLIDNRANEFRNKTNNLVDNIEKYNILADQSNFDGIERAARIVVIVDEFQEMFADENSSISKECKALITNIVKQGRAFGVHLILASQTLPDTLADVYTQMRNRIALQSTAESAKYILTSDNEGVATLANVEPGKGIFNNGAGDKDANHYFRVAKFSETEQEELLKKIAERQKDVIRNMHFEKTRLLLSTIQDDEDNPLNRFVMTGDLPKRTYIGCPLYVGEEISIENNFGINLTHRKAQNLLILGSDSKRAELIYGFSALSILFNEFISGNSLNSEPVITFFDFNSQTQSLYSYNSTKSIMDILCENFPDAIRIFGRNSLPDGIEILSNEYKNHDKKRNHYVIFAGLNRAKRLNENEDKYTIPLIDIFKNLIKEGAQNGFNYIIWANEPSGFMTSYSNIISEFDYRLVYDLTDEQYMFTVHSNEMKTNMSSAVISYNPDDDNKKVRIYNQPLQNWLNQFIERLKYTDDEYDEFNEFDEFSEFDEFGEF